MQPASWIVLSVANVSSAFSIAVIPPLFTIVRSISTATNGIRKGLDRDRKRRGEPG